MMAAIAAVATQEALLDTRADERRRERLTGAGSAARAEGLAAGALSATEAPTGLDGRTNGMDPQGPDFDTIDEDTVVPLQSFNDNRFIFEEAETIADGLGPTYNAQSCRSTPACNRSRPTRI